NPVQVPLFINQPLDQLFALKITDTSMDKILPLNAFVMVFLTAEINHNDIVVLKHNNSIVIRKYIETEMLQIFESVSHSHDLQPLLFLKSDPKNYIVIGKIIRFFNFIE
ncbi:MAG: S24 family peptidase, partial [Culicoidibacterales bacterium]